jgi:predicted PurR-regulated permease PerM
MHSLTIAVIVVAALYFGRDVFMPIALAVLLSFVLAIPVGIMQRFGLGRVFPVTIVVLLAFLGIFSIGGLIASQVTQLAGDLPRYQTTMREKISSLRGSAEASGPLARAADMLQELAGELAPPPKDPPGPNAPGVSRGADPGERERPVPVEITPGRSSPLETIRNIVSPILHPLATTGLVAIYVIFILLQRGDLRNRFIRLVGSHDLQRTTAAMNDAARRLSRFFLIQVLLNSSFGLVIGLGLWLIGVPSPILWGIVAAISRFIPYVGAVIAAGCPLILAAAVDPSWTMLLSAAALFALAELAVGQVIEPLLYGHSTGLSPVAVIVSVTFWTWLWGPVGLLLATPLTVCLVVMGRHVERMEFLDVMLGDRPPLTEVEVFYQRMLASDPAEATEQAEKYLKQHSLVDYYDEVAARGLALAQEDAARGVLDDARMEKIDKAAEDLIDNLADHEDVTPPDKGKSDAEKEGLDDSGDDLPDLPDLPVLSADDIRPEWREGTPILCIAGRNALDRVGACMLRQLLGKHGLAADVAGPEALTSTGIFGLDTSGTRLICLSYLDTSSPVHVRYAIRRLRRKAPEATILLGSWGVDEDEAKTLCETTKPDLCAGSFRAAIEICLEAARLPTADAETEQDAGKGSHARVMGLVG